MKQDHAADMYEYFDQFIENFILKGNSILSDHQTILTTENIDACIKRFVDNYNDSKKSFAEKVALQFKDASLETKLVFAHAEWLWSFAVDDISEWRKKQYTEITTGLTPDQIVAEIYPVGFGSAGMYHKNNKYEEIKFNLFLIHLLKSKIEIGELTSIESVKELIEKVCLYQKYELNNESPSEPPFNDMYMHKLAMSNILPHVCYPDKYERIASDNHKWQIVSSFSGLLKDEDSELEVDTKILRIRDELTALGQKSGFDFYEPEFSKIWNYTLSQEGFKEIQGLQYKKAIILYGPPGTGKTYTAKKLAEALVIHEFLKKKENVVQYFRSNDAHALTTKRIHHLQLHANYNYEDFVAGVQLKDNSTQPIKGKLFDICEKANEDRESGMPHVLILDEINRVDLSRLFGEVFSALENRNEDVEVGVGGFKLCIPDNLYVIGTMNEIDFSLERIDFALRRRFLWFFYGYKKEALSSMIWAKDKFLKTYLKDLEVQRFITNATTLNEAIVNLSELGKEYEIGHTFFAEVVDVYNSFKKLSGMKQPRKQLYRDNQDDAANTLWAISIEPIIKAFLGNMDSSECSKQLEKLKDIYISK